MGRCGLDLAGENLVKTLPRPRENPLESLKPLPGPRENPAGFHQAPPGFHQVFTRFSPACFSPSFHQVFTRVFTRFSLGFSPGFHQVFTRFSHWFSHGFSRWFLDGFPEWFLYRFSRDLPQCFRIACHVGCQQVGRLCHASHLRNRDAHPSSPELVSPPTKFASEYFGIRWHWSH